MTIAVQLFNDQGYDATSVADLAAKLGLTKSALYHHVESKESILAIALDDALTGLERALDVAIQHLSGVGWDVEQRFGVPTVRAPRTIDAKGKCL